MKTIIRQVIATALIAGAWACALADEVQEETVAFGERSFWLGGEEVLVVYGEGEFWLGPDEIPVASNEREFALAVFRNLPSNPTEEDIRAAVAASGARDKNRILALICDSENPVAAYSSFCLWAEKVGGIAVADSPYAGDSFALGAETLFENEPKVEFSSVSISASGEMEIAVTATDGKASKPVASEKVSKMFEVTRDLSAWTGDARLEPIVTDNTKGVSVPVTFTVKPGDGKSDKAFLRLKLK